jgi:hypothetical protein
MTLTGAADHAELIVMDFGEEISGKSSSSRGAQTVPATNIDCIYSNLAARNLHFGIYLFQNKFRSSTAGMCQGRNRRYKGRCGTELVFAEVVSGVWGGLIRKWRLENVDLANKTVQAI